MRAGQRGEEEELVLERNVAVIGWKEVGDLSAFKTKEELVTHLEGVYLSKSIHTIRNWANQLWSFDQAIQPGDLVALPLKSKPAVAVGRVESLYKYCPKHPPNGRHTRPVQWLTEIPRSRVPEDLLLSFGALQTVFRVQRNNAEERVRALIEGKEAGQAQVEEVEEGERELNLEEVALDQIRRFIQERFQGHRLADLVAAVLRAHGYRVRKSPPGPDGGVDILAGSGPLGLESPRIAVQVKSGEQVIDVKDIRELQGTLSRFKADFGLFVSWSGYKKSVLRERHQLFLRYGCGTRMTCCGRSSGCTTSCQRNCRRSCR